MAIKGLTDSPKTFTVLGKIRKGQLVATANGQSTKPVDLDYFRVTFRPDAKELEEIFIQAYGREPKRINIRLAFPTIPEVWDAFYECYARGGLVAQATDTDDGLRWRFYRNHETGDVLIRNGSPVNEAGRILYEQPILLDKPVYTYKTKDGETPVYLEPNGRLNVVVPEIAAYRVGYFEFCPGSPKDIRAISAELAGIDAWAKSAGSTIMAAKLVLTRREEEISKNINGRMSRGTSWMVHVELASAWGSRALTVLEQRGLPAPQDDDVVDGGDWETLPEQGSEPPQAVIPPQPKPETPVTPPQGTPKRPYAPVEFKAAYLEAVKKLPASYEKRNEKLEATEKDCGILAGAIEGILGGPLERSEFTFWLLGKSSTKEMSAAEIKTLLHIMGVKDFNQPPSVYSMDEIRAAYQVAIAEKQATA